MNFIDKLKNLVKEENEFDQIDDEDFGEDFDDGEFDYDSDSSFESRTLNRSDFSNEPEQRQNLYPITAGRKTSPHIVLKKVITPEDAKKAGALIKEDKVVMMNMEECGHDEQALRRILDFLLGVAFGRDGILKEVGSRVYLLAQNDIDISGEILDD